MFGKSINSTQDQSLQIFTAQDENVEDLIYEFLKDRSKRTAKSYHADLKSFFQFSNHFFGLPRVENNKLMFDDIRRVHIVKYKNFLEDHINKRGKNYAPNTINRKLSSVSSFFQFLLQREIINKNPAELCTRPSRTVVHETQAFTDREVKNLFDLVIEEAPPLHRAVILLLFTTGMRQAECRNLKPSNFKNIEGMRFVRYMAKGTKMNEVPLHPTAAHFIDEYMKWMEKRGRKIEQDDFLFQPSKNSTGNLRKRLSHTALGYIVKKWARKINPDKRITPHSARATFVSSLIENGESLYYVSQLVGHADTRTTQRYNKRARNHRRNPVFNLNFF